jgi:hypothetical protein
MKKMLVLFLITAGMFAMVSCSYRISTGPGHLPPGHAKKLVGSKSAKPFAPGQRKN